MTIYKLSVFQTIAPPTDIHGNPIVTGPPYSSLAKHLVAQELFDSQAKATAREAYYASTFPHATLSFEISSMSVG